MSKKKKKVNNEVKIFFIEYAYAYSMQSKTDEPNLQTPTQTQLR